MAEFDFNAVTDRRGSNAIKTDLAAARGKPDDVLPLWVADMDFPTAPCILEALHEKVRHGIFGYSCLDAEFFALVKDWMKRGHNFSVEDSWVVTTPGVVFAISCAIRAFTQENEGVIIQTPVYYPFRNMILANGRKLVTSPLLRKNGRYEMDFADFERKVAENGVRLFILCSPHNPVGRVWRRDELARIAEICLRHGVVIFSDEIHSDFVFGGNVHTVFASVSGEAADNCVISTSASKTFNLAGLQFSVNFIKNPNLRRKFRAEKDKTGYDEPAIMGLTATKAAYRSGGPWLSALKSHLKANLDFLRGYLAENLSEVKLIEPEGTYLVWLDFSGCGLSDGDLDDLIVNDAKVWLDRGTMFGEEGECFQRINIATPRPLLEEALRKIRAALRQSARS